MGKRKKKHPVINTSQADVAIVGGGLAGLATALALERSPDFCGSIRLFDPDPCVQGRREGYGLTLSYRPGSVLDHLGILDELAAEDCPSRSHYLLQSDGTVLGYFGNAFAASGTRGFGQRGNLRVPRQRLREILHSKLTSTTCYWSHRFVNMRMFPAEHSSEVEGLELEFVCTTTNEVQRYRADVLIAADGVRSAVASLELFRNILPPPKPLGIRLILGLTRNALPTSTLLSEQGFYTIDKGIRLFVMPYTGSSRRRSLNETEPVRFMWQLSFVDSYHGKLSPEKLQAEARWRTKDWHDPVPWLLDHTDVSSTWGTALYDRDPVPYTKLKSHNVLFAGDALHAMSPFKGQGANQSLQDAVTIASWLSRTNTRANVACCQQELVQRTTKVVQASRNAAQNLHSNQFLDEDHHWAGIAETKRLRQLLRKHSINASATEDLDAAINEIVERFSIARCDIAKTSLGKDLTAIEHLAIAAVRRGDVGTLRRISWSTPEAIANSTTCLKVAATETGDLAVIHWLVTEGGCNTRCWQDWTLKSNDIARLLRRLQ